MESLAARGQDSGHGAGRGEAERPRAAVSRPGARLSSAGLKEGRRISGLIGIAGAGLDPSSAAGLVARMSRAVTLAGESQTAGGAGNTLRVVAVHPSVRPAPPAPGDDEDVLCWAEGEVYSDSGPTDAGVTVRRAFAAPSSSGPTAHGLPTATTAALRRIDGTFAAVVYDRASQRVHLVTDRYGYGYVYWQRRPRRLVWSTTLAAFAAGADSPQVDQRAARQFLALGHLLGTRSWFHGVSLLPPGSVLTYDVETDRCVVRRYWHWGDLVPSLERPDLGDAADELGRRFRAAVARRCTPAGPTGVFLSGGLDSRAVLAAAPPHAPLHAVSFGRRGSADLAVARRVAQLRGVPHDIVTLDAENWLAPRLDALWLGGASSGLQHMHGVEAQPLCRTLFSEYLSGFGGDNLVRGDYLQSPQVLDRFDADYIAGYLHAERDLLEDLDDYAALGRCDHYFFDTQVRRLWAAPRAHERAFLFERSPFMDNVVVEFVYMLPDRLRYKGRLYSRMLATCFPEYFRGLGWANTGYPVTWPRGVRRGYRALRTAQRRLTGRVSTVGVRGLHFPGYADYPRWLRTDPGRTFVNDLLTAPTALYRDVVPDPLAAVAAWRRHLAGADETDAVLHHVTLEVWLRQVYRGEYRPAS